MNAEYLTSAKDVRMLFSFEVHASVQLESILNCNMFIMGNPYLHKTCY